MKCLNQKTFGGATVWLLIKQRLNTFKRLSRVVQGEYLTWYIYNPSKTFKRFFRFNVKAHKFQIYADCTVFKFHHFIFWLANNNCARIDCFWNIFIVLCSIYFFPKHQIITQKCMWPFDSSMRVLKPHWLYSTNSIFIVDTKYQRWYQITSIITPGC